jgi:hypothetical protein
MAIPDLVALALDEMKSSPATRNAVAEQTSRASASRSIPLGDLAIPSEEEPFSSSQKNPGSTVESRMRRLFRHDGGCQLPSSD